ncbi:MAG: hypothetical protein P8L37_03565 [Phycisphaerales bacterium]|nr:hypothetical protein [Phycisphaerales bacterium]
MRTLLFILLATTLAACSSPPPQHITGTWVSTYDGTVLDLMSDDAEQRDGIYVVQPSMTGAPPFTGQFRSTKTDVTLADDDGGPCSTMTGQYEFALLNDVMLMTLKHDECTLRSTIMEYAWTRSLSSE